MDETRRNERTLYDDEDNAPMIDDEQFTYPIRRWSEIQASIGDKT